VPLNGQRKYRVVVKAKGVSGAMSLLIRRQNKIGQTDSTYEDKTVTLTTDWQTITWETGLTAAGADGQNFKLYSHPTNGEIWLDSVRVFDITDETNIKATSDAVSSLTGTVTNQGNTLTSQGQSITALNNALEGVKGDVAKKADASAVSSLTNRVTQTEKDIRSQADSLTSLNTSLKQQATRGANVLPDGSFEPMPSAMFSVMPAPLSPVKLLTAGPKACVLRAVRSTTRTRRIITIPISFQACRFAITRSITWRRGLSCRLARPPIRPFIWYSDFPSRIQPMAGRGLA
jgi:hypothetical protein